MKFGAVSRYCPEERRTIQLLLANLVWGKLQLLKGLSNIISHEFFQMCYTARLLLVVSVLYVCALMFFAHSFMHNFVFFTCLLILSQAIGNFLPSYMLRMRFVTVPSSFIGITSTVKVLNYGSSLSMQYVLNFLI